MASNLLIFNPGASRSCLKTECIGHKKHASKNAINSTVDKLLFVVNNNNHLFGRIFSPLANIAFPGHVLVWALFPARENQRRDLT